MPRWSPDGIITKNRLISYAEELFDLFRKHARALIYSRNAVYQPGMINDHVLKLEEMLDNFDDPSARLAFQKEIKKENREGITRLINYYIDGLDRLGVDYTTVLNRPVTKTETYIKEIKNKTLRHTLAYAWRYGDEVTKKAVRNVLDGKADIAFDCDPYEAEGKTTREGDRITYHISSKYGKASRKNDLLYASFIMGHESYRDGKGSKNIFTTRRAVKADVAMARKITEDHGMEVLDDHPQMKRLLVFHEMMGEEGFEKYIDEYYDSSKDYLNIGELDDHMDAINSLKEKAAKSRDAAMGYYKSIDETLKKELRFTEKSHREHRAIAFSGDSACISGYSEYRDMAERNALQNKMKLKSFDELYRKSDELTQKVMRFCGMMNMKMTESNASHAEKKALVSRLDLDNIIVPAADISIGVTWKMCDEPDYGHYNCREFMKRASAYLKNIIVVSDKDSTYLFKAGEMISI
ncbi:MAG: hypothetical protein JW881_16760 [Spirochaetales bacterium]|nr:hypothetical protein [Spirochaetales bacterium]